MNSIPFKEKVKLLKEGEYSKAARIFVNTDFSCDINCNKSHRKMK